MTSSFPFRRAAATASAVAAVVLGTVVGSGVPTAMAQTPTNLPRTSVSGNYLAARHAGVERDNAAAASYYRAALRGDPRNNELLNRAFLAVLLNGEVDEAARLADRVLAADRNNREARLVLGVRALKQKQYPTARQQLAQAVRGPITDLAATLLSAWTYAAPNETKPGIDAIDKLSGPEWYNIFKELHAGLILETAGQRRDASRRLERAYKLDSNTLRIAQAYGGHLARAGNRDEALKVFKAFEEQYPRHPLISDVINDVNAGRRVVPIADSPQAGAAEVLYGLGAALGRQREDLGIIYLQLAVYLAPSHPLALLSLADTYEQLKKHEQAIRIYERFPATSSMSRNAQIQHALNLDIIERTDEAKTLLTKLIADDAADTEAIMALGNVLRGRKEYGECGDAYSKGIATIAKPERPNWVIYYYRGICYERAKQWPKAEADFKRALELYPDQPQVLNYLGYSWVDQGVNLDDGMRMIQRAVEQRPDDGYIVDSLGWAYYRISNYEEAVKHLEHAVELKPDDPTINDHLGDAYWRVGRELEARFQWSHARDLKPDAEELAKIEEKLRTGRVPEEPATAAEGERPKKPDGG